MARCRHFHIAALLLLASTLGCSDDESGDGATSTSSSSSSSGASSSSGSSSSASSSSSSASTGSGGESTGGAGGEGGAAGGAGGAGGGEGGAGGSGGGAASQVVLNEVTSDSDSNDQIELLNNGNTDVDIGGWSIVDDSLNMYTIPAGTTLTAGAYLVLVGGTDHMFGVGSDDAITLLDASMAPVDGADWATGEAVVSYCRLPNGTGAFQTCTAQTFGQPNM